MSVGAAPTFAALMAILFLWSRKRPPLQLLLILMFPALTWGWTVLHLPNSGTQAMALMVSLLWAAAVVLLWLLLRLLRWSLRKALGVLRYNTVTETGLAKPWHFERVNAAKVFWAAFGIVAVPLLVMWLAHSGQTLANWLYVELRYPIGTSFSELPPGFVILSPEASAILDEQIAFKRKEALILGGIVLGFSAACGLLVTALVLGLLYWREVFRAVTVWFRT